MARLRRKLRLPIQLYETTNQGRLKVGDALTAEIYPAGAQIEGSYDDATHGATPSIICSGRGSLNENNRVSIIRESGGVWSEIYSNLVLTRFPYESSNFEGHFVWAITFVGSYNLQPGDRVVAFREGANRISLYEDEADLSPSGGLTDDIAYSQPVDVPSNGVIECFVDVNDVDVYLSGDTITDSWYGFNIPSYSGLMGPFRLRGDDWALDTNSTAGIDIDTGVVRITDTTFPLAAVSGCSENRVVLVTAETAGFQITTTNTKADNSIYSATPGTIDIGQDEVVMLLGHEASTDVAYWTILGTPTLIDLSTADITDINLAGGTTGDVLYYISGTGVVALNVIGAAGNEITGAMDDATTFLGSGGGTFRMEYAGAGNTVLTVPTGAAASETLVLQDQAYTFRTGNKVFDDDIFWLREPVALHTARFDLGLLSTDRVVSLPDRSFTVADANDIVSIINDLSDVNTSGLVDGSPLTWVAASGEFQPNRLLGTAVNPILGMVIDHDTLMLINGSGNNATFDASLLTTDRAFQFPNLDGTFLLTSGAQTISGQKSFVDGASGFKLYSAGTPANTVSFDLSRLTAARTFDMPDNDGVVAVMDVAGGSLKNGSVPRWNSSSDDWEYIGSGTYETIGSDGNPQRIYVGATNALIFYELGLGGKLTLATTPSLGIGTNYTTYIKAQNQILANTSDFVPTTITGEFDVVNGTIVQNGAASQLDQYALIQIAEQDVEVTRVVLEWYNGAGSASANPVFSVGHSSSPLAASAIVPYSGFNDLVGPNGITPAGTARILNNWTGASLSNTSIPQGNYIYFACTTYPTSASGLNGKIRFAITYDKDR